MSLRLTTMAFAVAALTLTACESVQQPVPPNTLVANKVATPPNPSAFAADPAWANARALSVPLSGGANFGGKGETTATLKAVYSGDTLYMLVQYADPTQSVRRGPYQKQADGTWKQLKSADNKGGDENAYYEDKWAFIWNIGNSIKNWDKEGCAATCHEGQGKPYGNKYTASPGELGDIWHMKGSRTAPWGFVDDQYVDHTRYDPKASPNAGRKNEPGPEGGEYKGFPLVDGKPQFMNRDARALTAGGTQYIKRGDEVPFDDSRFKPGDEVASYIVNKLDGTDRGDVRLALQWKDGMYTSVVSRKLVTGSKFDVQFDDLKARYGFGFAAFDNAQVRHATGDDPLYLVFGR
ncbi:MAG TPA: ethylbenzene dehydrogenase-related protein [Albitalea sp.]